MPLLPIYADQFSMDSGGWTIGALMASFSFMQFIFAPLWGMLSDRIGRRPVLIAGLSGSVLFYSVSAYATWINSLAFTGDADGPPLSPERVPDRILKLGERPGLLLQVPPAASGPGRRNPKRSPGPFSCAAGAPHPPESGRC